MSAPEFTQLALPERFAVPPFGMSDPGLLVTVPECAGAAAFIGSPVSDQVVFIAAEWMVHVGLNLALSGINVPDADVIKDRVRISVPWIRAAADVAIGPRDAAGEFRV